MNISPITSKSSFKTFFNTEGEIIQINIIWNMLNKTQIDGLSKTNSVPKYLNSSEGKPAKFKRIVNIENP